MSLWNWIVKIWWLNFFFGFFRHDDERRDDSCDDSWRHYDDSWESCDSAIQGDCDWENDDYGYSSGSDDPLDNYDDYLGMTDDCCDDF